MASGYDGSIRFDTSINSKGFNRGLARITSSMAGVQKAIMNNYDSYVTGVAKLGAKMLTSVQNSQKLSPAMKKLFSSIITGGSGAAMALGTVVAAAGAVVTAVAGIAIAIAAIIAILAIAGIAIFAWAQKFTNTLYRTLSVTSAYRAEVVQLKAAFDTLKGSMAALGTTLLTAIAPALMKIINWLVTAINYVSMFIAALRGQTSVMQYVSGSMDNTSNATGSAADNAERLARNTKKAGDAAKGALAGFDQLNVLQMNDDQPEPDTTAGGGAVGGNLVLMPVDIDPKILDTVRKIKEFFGDAWAWVANAATVAWGWIAQAASDAWIWIRRAWTNTGTFFLNLWAGIKNAASAVWNWIVSIWRPIATWFKVNVINPIAARFSEFMVVLREFGQLVYTGVIKPVIDWIVNRLWPIIQQVFGWIGQFLSNELSVIGRLWSSFADWMVNLFSVAWNWLKNVFKSVWDTIVLIFKNVWLIFSGVVSGIIQTFTGIIQFLTGAFTGNWSRAWQGIQNIFSGIWNSIFTLSKGIINSIIGLINAMIRGLVSGLNAVISALNSVQVSIPSWVPGLGGRDFGINLGYVSAPQIPYLAKGAVIPPNSQFMAVLGDQRSGRNLEAPEGLIRQIFREEMGGMGGEQKVTIDFGNSSLGALIRTLNPIIKQENDRMGTSMISGATS